MKEANVIRRLKDDAKRPISIDEEKKNAMIEMIVCRELPIRKKSSWGEFVLLQLGFVNKIVWFWQGVWMLFFFYAVGKGDVFHFTNETLYILSMAPPLLLLLTVEEVARIYNRSMLEIEYATKYSLKKVVMTRMLVLSIINGGLLFGGIFFAKEWMEMRFIEVLVYSLTPFLLMTFLILKMMTKWQGVQLHYVAISVYICFLLVIVVGGMEQFDIYRQNIFGIWICLFVVGLIATIIQWRRLGQYLECFEILTN